MNFTEFESGIESPALKEVAAHWNQARRERRMPAWSDIKPTRIAPHLSLVWSFRYDAINREFAGRLVGESIHRHIGKSFKGLSLAEAYPPEALPWVVKLFERVVTEPALYNHAGLVFRQQDRDGLGERVLMPLSEDGDRADGVLGATLLHAANSMPMTLVAPARKDERWYPLLPLG
jgi:hypothetical protein